MAAESVGRFGLERAGLPAIALTADSSIITAVGNDYGFEQVFARQVRRWASRGDLSPLARAEIHLMCSEESKKLEGKLKTIALTGMNGGALAKQSDLAIRIPSTSTARIHQCHIVTGHLFCELVDADFGEAKSF